MTPGHEYVVKEVVPAGYALDSIGVVTGSDVSATAEFTWQVDGTVTVKAVNSNTEGNGIGSLTKVFETNGFGVEDVTFELYQVLSGSDDKLVATVVMKATTFNEDGKASLELENWVDETTHNKVSSLAVGDYYAE